MNTFIRIIQFQVITFDYNQLFVDSFIISKIY